MNQYENIEPDKKKWDHTNDDPIIVTCSNCGTSGVTRDATVRWDVQSQRWELSGVFDNGDCDICGQSRLEDTPVLQYLGDACIMEKLPNKNGLSILAANVGDAAYVGSAFIETNIQMKVLDEAHSSAEEAKNAIRQWLFEEGHL